MIERGGNLFIFKSANHQTELRLLMKIPERHLNLDETKKGYKSRYPVLLLDKNPIKKDRRS